MGWFLYLVPAQIVRLDETARFGEVTITPLRVLEDSRCPAEVECIWAGQLLLEVNVEQGKEETGVIEVMSVGSTIKTQVGFVTLDTVLPDARVGEISAEEYEFNFSLADTL